MWFEKAEFDAPELNSPQPCVHGAGCAYMVKKDDPNKPGESIFVSASCRYVHPGEEGNGRRIFPAREGPHGPQPAVVRLTGRAGFYERRRLRLSWAEWCEQNEIPYTPNKSGEEHPPVVRVPIGGARGPPKGVLRASAPVWQGAQEAPPSLQASSAPLAAPGAPKKLTKNQRKRANAKERRAAEGGGGAEAASSSPAAAGGGGGWTGLSSAPSSRVGNTGDEVESDEDEGVLATEAAWVAARVAEQVEEERFEGAATPRYAPREDDE